MASIASVAATELIRSTTFGNAVGNELNNRTMKVTGLTEVGGPMTGSLVINASPAMKLRRAGDLPYLQFEDTTGVTRFGYLQGSATQMNYLIDNSVGEHRFVVGSTEVGHFDSTGLDVIGTLTATTGLVSNLPGKFGGDGAQLQLIDTSTSGSDFHDCFLAYYGAGVSMVSPGTRTGYVGYASSTSLQLRNEVASGDVVLTSGSSGDINLTTGAAGNIVLNGSGVVTFNSGGAERGRVNGSLMWGKTAGGQAIPGVELFEAGTIYSTTATNGVVNMIIRHNTNADDVAYVQFANASGTVLAEINQDNTAPVGIKITNCAVSAPSDYRLKNDLGPIVGALDRVMQLLPKHLAWKDTGREFDGFIAHELATVVPDAVYGDKDAVYDADEAERMGVEPGDIKAQQLDQLPLIPLLTAALQEAVARIEALEDA